MQGIAINKAHYPVTVLGYGRRIGIWTQGCSRGCIGCISRDTWAHDPDKLMSVGTLLEWCRQFSNQGVDGVTISGGEPFEQAEALESLFVALREWIDTLPNPVDLLCYSGFSYKMLSISYPLILRHLDAIITEPFLQEHPSAFLRGSSNQQIIPLTELGNLRYSYQSPEKTKQKRFQIAVEPEGTIWFIGIPERGDMEQIEAHCAIKGLIIGGHSWKA
jgi:anaerobic ribonucleoside-triphosphate reductase activating protein